MQKIVKWVVSEKYQVVDTEIYGEEADWFVFEPT